MCISTVFLRKCRKPLWNEFPVATPLTKTKAYILNATEPRPTVVGGGGTAGATMAVNTTSTANTSATNYTYSVEFRRGITTEVSDEESVLKQTITNSNMCALTLSFVL